MEFNWGTGLLAFLFFVTYSELLTTRKLTQRLNEKVDTLNILMVNIQSDVADASLEASEAKQAALDLLNKEERESRSYNPFG